jgi:hypothetical protein
VQRAVDDDDLGAIGLNENQIVAFDVNIVDRGAGRQVGDVVLIRDNLAGGRGAAVTSGAAGRRPVVSSAAPAADLFAGMLLACATSTPFTAEVCVEHLHEYPR